MSKLRKKLVAHEHEIVTLLMESILTANRDTMGAIMARFFGFWTVYKTSLFTFFLFVIERR